MSTNKNLKVVIKNQGQEVVNRLFTEFPIVFGRGVNCHISFPDNQFLSRTHGSISYVNSILVLEDMGSRNGILLNGEQINGPVKLNSSGTFIAGGLEFFVLIQEEEIKADQFENTAPNFDARELRKNMMNEKTNISVEEKAPRYFDPKILEQKPPPPRPVDVKPAPRMAAPPPQARYVEKEHDLGEYTVVSKRLVHVARDLRLEDESDFKNIKPDDLTLQGVVTWGRDIFDVRQFQNLDRITIGGTQFDPVYVPFLKKKLNLGLVYQNKGYLTIPKNIRWRLDRKGYSFSPGETLEQKITKDMGQAIQVPLVLHDLCTIDLGEDVSLHFRYVKVPRPLVKRTWIENREEIKKAITASMVVHLAVALIAMFAAPKTQAPQIENVPPRFAKLLVDPPKLILAPPEIPKPEPVVEVKPEPIKEEPPPPPVVEKKPDPPKKKPIVKKKPIEKPVPVAKPQPKPQKQPKPQPVQEVAAKPQPRPAQPAAPAKPAAPPPPSVEDSFANAFASATPSAASKVANAPIKITKGATSSGPVGTPIGKGLAGTLKSKVGEVASAGESMGSSVGASVGQVGYAKAGGNAKVGKRGIASVVVGIPKLKESDIPQGLTQAQIMTEVNKHLADVRRCYERALFQDSNLVGRVEFEWDISPKGAVSRPRVARSGVSNGDFLNNCVIGVIGKMKFPAAKNGQPTVANIGFPFGKE